jgi:hypothetical protein
MQNSWRFKKFLGNCFSIWPTLFLCCFLEVCGSCEGSLSESTNLVTYRYEIFSLQFLVIKSLDLEWSVSGSAIRKCWIPGSGSALTQCGSETLAVVSVMIVGTALWIRMAFSLEQNKTDSYVKIFQWPSGTVLDGSVVLIFMFRLSEEQDRIRINSLSNFRLFSQLFVLKNPNVNVCRLGFRLSSSGDQTERYTTATSLRPTRETFDPLSGAEDCVGIFCCGSGWIRLIFNKSEKLHPDPHQSPKLEAKSLLLWSTVSQWGAMEAHNGAVEDYNAAWDGLYPIGRILASLR